jgi:hypothetical protein
MGDFIEWLKGLELQTLTDELKLNIIEQAEIAAEAEYIKGYTKAGKDAVDYINSYNK